MPSRPSERSVKSRTSQPSSPRSKSKSGLKPGTKTSLKVFESSRNPSSDVFPEAFPKMQKSSSMIRHATISTNTASKVSIRQIFARHSTEEDVRPTGGFRGLARLKKGGKQPEIQPQVQPHPQPQPHPHPHPQPYPQPQSKTQKLSIDRKMKRVHSQLGPSLKLHIPEAASEAFRPMSQRLISGRGCVSPPPKRIKTEKSLFEANEQKKKETVKIGSLVSNRRAKVELSSPVKQEPKPRPVPTRKAEDIDRLRKQLAAAKLRKTSSIKIQRWWRRILIRKKQEIHFRELSQDLENSLDETLFVLDRQNQVLDDDEENSEPTTFRQPPAQLQNVLAYFRRLSRQQLSIWQMFERKLGHLMIGNQPHPLLQRLQSDSKKNIKMLKTRLKAAEVSELSDRSFHARAKTDERWIKPKKEMQKRLSIELMQNSLFNSSVNSQSIVLFKDSKDRNSTSASEARNKSADLLSLKPIADEIFSEALEEAINFFVIRKSKSKLINELKIPVQGIKVDVASLHKYLNSFSEFLIVERIENLAFLACNQIQKTQVLPLQLFIDYEEVILDSSLNSDQLEWTHILHKLYFDSLCEALNLLRKKSQPPYPMKALQKKSSASIVRLLEGACNKLLSWNELMCGLIYSKELHKLNPQEQQYLGHIKEERLKILLKDFVMEEIESHNLETSHLEAEIAEWIFEQVLQDVTSSFK